MELDAIQSRLMAAIQNHQILVSKIKLQPQEMTLKIQLQQLQKEILLMSQQQTHVVKKLRQELVERKTEGSHEATEHYNTYSTPVWKPESTGSTPRNADIQLDTSSIKACPPPLRVPNFIGRKAVSKENKPTSTKAIEVTETKCQRNNCHRERDESTDNNSNERARQLKQKLDFMASIDLVPPDSLKELSGKRSERKRRSTNNPNFAYGFELVKRPKVSHFQASDYFGARKPKCSVKPTAVIPEEPSSSVSPSNTPSSPDFPLVDSNQNDTKENKVSSSLCTICGQSGQVVMCKSCHNTYHPQCLSLPVTHEEQWNCLKCQDAIQKSALSLSVINAYISRKAGKEEDKKKLLKRNTELHEEMTNLDYRKQQVNDVLTHQAIQKQELIDLNQKTKQSMENLKSFVKRVHQSS